MRSFHHRDYPTDRLASGRTQSVSVCVPVRNEAKTIASVVETLSRLRAAGVVDEIVVVDAASTDGSAEIAAAGGATVYQQDALEPQLGRALGKGDALYRALGVLAGEIICFVDGDSEDFGPHFVRGLIGPLLEDPALELVKGHYSRPFRTGATSIEDGGGRVTELMARPLLNLFYPELAGFRQPLAGELAARRAVLERLPFTTGYGVEIGLLVDAWAAVGTAALAQTDLGRRQNRHQPLSELSPMAYAVLLAVARRLAAAGRLGGPLPETLLHPVDGVLVERPVPLVERPPRAARGLSGRPPRQAPPRSRAL
ncbi:MAG: glucosyl-3-phosphoglycerate synthase [Thermoleophilaceae bacterium]